MKLIGTTLALGAALFMVGCSTSKSSVNNFDRPEADLTKTVGIFEGMTQDRVAEVMGMYPLNVELSDGITEWHYCATGLRSSPDNYVAVYFADSKVIAMSNYQVTGDEGGYGHCSMFVKRGNYHEPQIVVDMRVSHSYNRRRY